MNWSKEMLAALEADGEKLRQLTGEDHGPFEFPEFCSFCDGTGTFDDLTKKPGAVIDCVFCNGTGDRK